jgi:hypothetical protein
MRPHATITRSARRTIAVGAVVAVVAVVLGSSVVDRAGHPSAGSVAGPTSIALDGTSTHPGGPGAMFSRARRVELAAVASTPRSRRGDALGTEGRTEPHRPGSGLGTAATSTPTSNARVGTSSRGPPSTSVD